MFRLTAQLFKGQTTFSAFPTAELRVIIQICTVLAERVDRKRVLAKVKQKASLLLAEGLAEKALEKYSELIKTGESDAGALWIG